MRTTILLGLAALLCGCGTLTNVRVVDAGSRPLILAGVHTNVLATAKGDSTVVLPAGIYQPDFQADQGLFYRAPARILFMFPRPKSPTDDHALSATSVNVLSGGLVVIPGGRIAVWYEPRSGGSGAPPEIYQVKNPVPIQN